jgi:hypothetical protein
LKVETGLKRWSPQIQRAMYVNTTRQRRRTGRGKEIFLKHLGDLGHFKETQDLLLLAYYNY